jgi:hypothetical protein
MPTDRGILDNIVVGDLPTTSVEPSVLAGSSLGITTSKTSNHSTRDQDHLQYHGGRVCLSGHLRSTWSNDQDTVSKKRPAGNHSITERKNDHGTSAPSGVLLFARTGSVTETRKMVLLVTPLGRYLVYGMTLYEG